MTKTLTHSNVQFGGYWHFTLDSVPETRAENSNEETLFFKQTAKLAMKFWFGNQREDPRCAMAIVIREHLIQPLRQQTMNNVQFIITRNSGVTIQQKWINLTALFTWPSIIEEDQDTAFGTTNYHSAKTRFELCSKNMYFSPHGCRSPVNYVTQLSRHRNLESLDSYKAGSVEHQRKMTLILSCSCEQSTQSSTVSSLVHKSNTVPVNLPNVLNPRESPKPGVFSGACIGNIEGCSFTFNIQRPKEESPKSAKPKKRRIIISDDSDSD